MDHDFRASSKQARSILAMVAVLATLLVVGAIDGLSLHYGSEAQLASVKSVTLANR